MTRIPLGDTGYDIEKIPIERITRDDILLFDFGNGPQLFVIDNLGIKSVQQSPGKYVNTFTLTLTLQEGGGTPQTAERRAGEEVARLVKST